MSAAPSRLWFEQAFASSPHGMLLLDDHGRVEQANAAAARLFGWTASELVGRAVDDLVAPEGRRKLELLRARFTAGRGGPPRRDVEILGQHRDGRTFPVAVGLGVIERDGRPRVLISVADLSRRLRAEQRIRSQNDALRDAIMRRTAELEEANARLLAEVEERRRTERELRAVQRRLQELNSELTRLALIDDLTGLANRRHFESRLWVEYQRAARTRSPLSLVMVDIDFFKRFNDHAGHPAGDDCLRRVARVVAGCLRRPGDLIARFGGEELAAVLPDTPHEGALQIARSMLAAVRAAAIRHPAAPSGLVTISAGVASTDMRPTTSARELLQAADRALYLAKARGRDRVCGAIPAVRDVLTAREGGAT
ncbi:MAG TPA: sensor domain-containing diguanylate cyclase [Planctomycetota bacterium]|nr:sensor domain-containing diguanylate cyclase [Planctomycetota bacterium]